VTDEHNISLSRWRERVGGEGGYDFRGFPLTCILSPSRHKNGGIFDRGEDKKLLEGVSHAKNGHCKR
jgi:hypothetical protein